MRDLRDFIQLLREKGQLVGHRRSGRPGARDHRDRRPGGQGRRSGAPVHPSQGLVVPGAHQPVRQRRAHVPGSARRLLRRGGRPHPDPHGFRSRRRAPGRRSRPWASSRTWPACSRAPSRAAPARKWCKTGADIDLGALPVLQCWPLDAGRFITLPLVFTKHPADRPAQRGHVPAAGLRPRHHRDALAHPQGCAPSTTGWRRSRRRRGAGRRARPGAASATVAARAPPPAAWKWPWPSAPTRSITYAATAPLPGPSTR